MATATTATTVRPITSKKASTSGTAYRSLDDSIHHARCHHRLAYQGMIAGGLEIQFHCAACHERVTMPQFLVNRLPLVTTGAA
jgi:hypothetical protein